LTQKQIKEDDKDFHVEHPESDEPLLDEEQLKLIEKLKEDFKGAKTIKLMDDDDVLEIPKKGIIASEKSYAEYKWLIL
jgi:hypothetical protein